MPITGQASGSHSRTAKLALARVRGGLGAAEGGRGPAGECWPREECRRTARSQTVRIGLNSEFRPTGALGERGRYGHWCTAHRRSTRAWRVRGRIRLAGRVQHPDQRRLQRERRAEHHTDAGWRRRSDAHESFAGELPADDAAFMADSQVRGGVDATAGTIGEPAWRTKPTWYLLRTAAWAAADCPWARWASGTVPACRRAALPAQSARQY
jgi:hypothetical protein